MTGAVPVVDVTSELHGRFAELLADAPVDSEGDGAARIALAILSSETLDDVAAIFSGGNNAMQYMDVPLLIDSFVIRESSYDGGIGAYATVTGRKKSDNSDVSFNVGSMSVLAVLLLAHKRGWFPLAAHMTSKTTKSGNTVYNLIPDE